MSKIRSKNTKPEIALRKALFAKGYRFRIDYKKLPGKPDIVFPKYKTAIFVHGCFWHGHGSCIDSHIPKTNSTYWLEKIEYNQARDRNNVLQILSLGWKVLTVWDCEIQKRNKLEVLIDKIEVLLYDPIPYQSKSVSIKFYKEIEDSVMEVAEDVIPYQKTVNDTNLHQFFRDNLCHS